MRRVVATAMARPVVVAAAHVLGTSPAAAWEPIAGPSSRKVIGQPPPEVTLVRSAALVALFERGVPFMTAACATGSRRRQANRNARATVVAIAQRLSVSAPAVLAAARSAARAAVRAATPPKRRATQAAVEALVRREVEMGVDADRLSDPYDRQGSAARRRIARTLVAAGHTRANVADSMGWTLQAVDHWVKDRRGGAVKCQPEDERESMV